MEPIKLVARYTQDFSLNIERFHVIPVDKLSGGAIEVSVGRLKAIFAVQDFNGDPQYKERKTFMRGESSLGMRLELTFNYGEVIAASTLQMYHGQT